MQLQAWQSHALALYSVLSFAFVSVGSWTQADDLRALEGEWIFVEDRTQGRIQVQLGPPMANKFSMHVEEGVVVLNGHGSGHRDVRVALDGSITEVKEAKTISRYRGAWKRERSNTKCRSNVWATTRRKGSSESKGSFATHGGALSERFRRAAAGEGFGWALPSCRGYQNACSGQGHHRRPQVAGRCLGWKEEHRIIDRRAMESTAR